MKVSAAAVAAIALFGVGIGLGACGGPPASMSAQIRQWSVGANFPDLDSALEADFPEVAAGVASGHLKALKTACAGLSIDAGNVYNTLLTPDHELSDALANALSGFGRAGDQCSALTSDTPTATKSLRHTLAVSEALYAKERKIILLADRR